MLRGMDLADHLLLLLRSFVVNPAGVGQSSQLGLSMSIPAGISILAEALSLEPGAESCGSQIRLHPQLIVGMGVGAQIPQMTSPLCLPILADSCEFERGPSLSDLVARHGSISQQAL